MGSFQDEYGEGHWDTQQQAWPPNDPITGFEMDPGAEFRNLKWKGWGEAILQLDKRLIPKSPLERRGYGTAVQAVSKQPMKIRMHFPRNT